VRATKTAPGKIDVPAIAETKQVRRHSAEILLFAHVPWLDLFYPGKRILRLR
jgi:hypothetical protein